MTSQRTARAARIAVKSHFRRPARRNGYPELRQKPAASPRVSEGHGGGAQAVAPRAARRLVRETDQRIPGHLEAGRGSLGEWGKSLRGSVEDRRCANHGSDQKTPTAGKPRYSSQGAAALGERARPQKKSGRRAERSLAADHNRF